ncbi:hypothetical protein CF138_18300 [Aeromonas hydrophila]|nr:hypothetical protein CF138_18300 [Aeromonas hydrophila]TNH93522.1 hypothetical protein CF136_22090 [Aeromonas hydrophila]TNI98952.1 hypothetical protein CF118_04595 [Aeromonas hydrophila]
MMTQYLLMVAITCPLTVVLATAGVSAAISHPGRTGDIPSKASPYHSMGQRHIQNAVGAMHCALPLHRARDAAIPSQLHIVILPALRRLLALLRGDAFPPATGL